MNLLAKIGKGLLALVVILVAAYMLGPRVETPSLDTTLPEVTADLVELEKEIAVQEQAFTNIKPGNEARIIWYDSIPTKNLVGVPTGAYVFHATDQLGCDARIEYLLENGPTTVETPLVAPKIQIYPNPSRSGELVVLSSDVAINFLLIRDLQGRLLHSWSLNLRNTTLDLSDLPPSTYLAQIVTDQGIFTERILILR